MSEVAEFREETNWNRAEIHEKLKVHKEDSQIFLSTPLPSVNRYSLLFCSRRAEGYIVKFEREKGEKFRINETNLLMKHIVNLGDSLI